MSKTPYFPLYVSDFLGDTMHLSTEQVGAYMLMLMALWNSGGELQDDEKKLARIARVSVKKWRSMRGEIAEFFTVSNDIWTHERLVKERQKIAKVKRDNAFNGAKGGRAKSLKNNNPHLATASVSLKQYHNHNQKEVIYLSQSERNEWSIPKPKSENKFDDLESKLLDAASIRGNPPTGLIVLAPIIGLIDAGFDLEKDILPIVRAKSKSHPGFVPGSWNYYVKAVQQAAQSKNQASSVKKPSPVDDVKIWADRLHAFQKTGVWAAWGPPPGENGCQVPNELLQDQEIKHG